MFYEKKRRELEERIAKEKHTAEQELKELNKKLKEHKKKQKNSEEYLLIEALTGGDGSQRRGGLTTM